MVNQYTEFKRLSSICSKITDDFTIYGGHVTLATPAFGSSSLVN